MDREINHLTKSLNFIFNNCEISPTGQVIEKRYLVSQINNLKVVIHPNEHPPPHFHIIGEGINASIDVLTCELLKGDLKSSDLKKIQHWHGLNTALIIRKWNETRPTDCPVGKIVT